jgi:hypothetical protein
MTKNAVGDIAQSAWSAYKKRTQADIERVLLSPETAHDPRGYVRARGVWGTFGGNVSASAYHAGAWKAKANQEYDSPAVGGEVAVGWRRDRSADLVGRIGADYLVAGISFDVDANWNITAKTTILGGFVRVGWNPLDIGTKVCNTGEWDTTPNRVEVGVGSIFYPVINVSHPIPETEMEIGGILPWLPPDTPVPDSIFSSSPPEQDPLPSDRVEHTERKAEDDSKAEPTGGFSSGEGEIITTELPGGGFSSGEGEITKTELPGGGFSGDDPRVITTELPGVGFSGSEGQIVKVSPKKEAVSGRKPRQSRIKSTSDDDDWDFSNDPDFTDPFLDEDYGEPVGPVYGPVRPTRTWRPTVHPSRGSGWTSPRRRSAPVNRVSPRAPSQRGGVGFLGGARRVSPERARQLQRSFR